ncbi:MAG: Ubiquinone/menaquinone biosynthesis methyltransferase UbiE [Myxococcaceae bacterium]|nr:Ubiquinone/menaquinone biosynthesis methyltransferase UbiE [Myxococcaceae bacterium]
MTDPIARFKENAKQAWSTFAPSEMMTASVAPTLVRHARITSGADVLDVGCGTGVVALTAARLGANVRGLDLTPELLTRARENAAIMKLDVAFEEGDVEALPFADGAFDVVVSQFGHMFAPRPEVATKEMLRVLRPGGVIAFSTWPPEHFVGKMFALLGKYGPTPPPGVSPPPQWGDVDVVRERLGNAVKDVCFARGVMQVQVLSVQHHRMIMERNIGPMTKLVEMLEASDPAKLATLRREFEELVSLFFENNHVVQDYLLTRATKL